MKFNISKKWCAQAAKLEQGVGGLMACNPKYLKKIKVVKKQAKTLVHPKKRTDVEWLSDCAATAQSQMDFDTAKRCRRIARQLKIKTTIK
jgi:hypothetical protein